MKRAVVIAALASLAVSPLMAAGKGTLSGVYVEARTAEVFTGGCIMNSEAETMGKQAVLAWKVDRGTFNGVTLDGLSVAEVADLTESTAVAVRTRVWRARRELFKRAGKDPVLSGYLQELAGGST